MSGRSSRELVRKFHKQACAGTGPEEYCLYPDCDDFKGKHAAFRKVLNSVRRETAWEARDAIIRARPRVIRSVQDLQISREAIEKMLENK